MKLLSFNFIFYFIIYLKNHIPLRAAYIHCTILRIFVKLFTKTHKFFSLSVEDDEFLSALGQKFQRSVRLIHGDDIWARLEICHL
jgi:hypothetical protein